MNLKCGSQPTPIPTAAIIVAEVLISKGYSIREASRMGLAAVWKLTVERKNNGS